VTLRLRANVAGRRSRVAEVAAAILASPTAHIGKVYELTGPRSQDMHALAAEYSDALGRTITYVDVPFEEWRDQELRSRNLPDYVFEHLLTMARLHAANRYDRLTHDVETITGKPATSARDFVARHALLFEPNSPPTKPMARLERARRNWRQSSADRDRFRRPAES
jgi:NAD(P)H dehydrogenase (quinone)